MKNLKRRLLPFVAAGGLMLAMAAPAAAVGGPVVTGGVINVTIVDLLDLDVRNVTVQLPIAVAANICDTAILVNEDTGDLECTAIADSRANR